MADNPCGGVRQTNEGTIVRNDEKDGGNNKGAIVPLRHCCDEEVGVIVEPPRLDENVDIQSPRCKDDNWGAILKPPLQDDDKGAVVRNDEKEGGKD